MATEAEIQLARRSRVVGNLTQITVPEFPRMPASMIQRFPELDPYQNQIDAWRNAFQDQLNLAATRDRSERQTTI